MSAVTIRNLPEATHRALKMRAARNGRSTEAEIRDILESAIRPADRVKLGSLLVGIGRRARLRAGLRDDDVLFDHIKTPTEPIGFE